ncbi:MAG: TlpA disulfide reductase family protein [Nitrosomonas sp.]|nr:TlpA disulfide reductase family protein [Nitrosomonas sp.]
MSKFGKIALYAVIAFSAMAAGFFFKAQQLTPQLSSDEKKRGVEKFFSSGLPDVKGDMQPFSQWQGNVLLVNFWATWCAPCQEEIPEFIQAQEIYRDKGLVLIGIAVDQPDRVASFSRDFGINYPVVVGELDAFSLAEAMGNPQGALPFTVILNRAGEIVYSHLGRIKIEEIEKIIKPLL